MPRSPSPTKLETLVAVAPLLAVLVVPAFWWWVDRQEAAAAQRHVDSNAGQAALRLQDFVRARLRVTQSVAEAIDEGLLSEEAAFVAHTEALQQELGGYLAINRIAADGRITWVSPRRPNRRARGKNVFDHPRAGGFATRARDTDRATITGPLTLFQGMRGFTTYFPVTKDGRFDGFVNGVFDTHALVQDALAVELLSDFEIELLDDATPIYVSAAYPKATSALQAERTLSVLDRAWRIRLRPNHDTALAVRPRQHDTWAIMAMLAALVFLGLALAWRTARRRQRALEVAQLQLQMELRHAQKMEALGRLAGGLAHDFNNLLTALTGHAELALLQDDLPEEAIQSLDEILDITGQGAEMTESLLAFSRDEPARVARFDPGPRLARLQRTFRHLVGPKIRTHFETPEGLGFVAMDPSQLDRAIMNLVVNAVDAMPEGGQLDVRLSADDDWLIVEVVDTGVGIDEATRERMFEPFFTTKESQGNGLGLAQVWDTVHRAGGKVSCASEVGRGTHFTLRLPQCGEMETPSSGTRRAPQVTDKPTGQLTPVPPKPQ